LTYSVHAASTVLAGHERLRSRRNLPRRNRCFHSSIGKRSRAGVRRLQRSPLTDGRDAVSRAAVKGPIPMWGFHTDREDDPEGHLAKVKRV